MRKRRQLLRVKMVSLSIGRKEIQKKMLQVTLLNLNLLVERKIKTNQRERKKLQRKKTKKTLRMKMASLRSNIDRGNKAAREVKNKSTESKEPLTITILLKELERMVNLQEIKTTRKDQRRLRKVMKRLRKILFI